MAEYNIPNNERECIIAWAADQKTAKITTSNPAMIRRLDRLSEAHPDEYKKVRELTRAQDAIYEMPVKRLRFGKPASEAVKEACRRKAALLHGKPTGADKISNANA